MADDKEDYNFECPNCDEKFDLSALYEIFLKKLFYDIENLPQTYESRCPSCKEVKTIPSYVWGRYCQICNYKLPGPIGWLSVGSCAEDICAIVLNKFDPQLKLDKFGNNLKQE